jgi:hypothetical protein
MIEVGIESVGVIGPGIAGWRDAVAVLLSPASFDIEAEQPRMTPARLRANERRRVTPLISMVMQCCEDALVGSNNGDTSMRSVFASSCGDLLIVDRILSDLALPDKPVSPTDFHNSVHNAPAAYWSIARGDDSASTSIAAYDSSFSAGFLEAVGSVRLHGGRTLFVAYDHPPPPPLQALRPLAAPFAVALILRNAPARWRIEVTLEETGAVDSMRDPGLEVMRLGNPAARALPLLERLANKLTGSVKLPYQDNLAVAIEIVACAND